MSATEVIVEFGEEILEFPLIEEHPATSIRIADADNRAGNSHTLRKIV
ncbi:MAG: hypothetical protein ABSC47_03310 [Terracidiphilus sp.]